MTDKLLNCPFCGSDNIDGGNWPGCIECGATADTAERWNQRAAPPVAQPSQTDAIDSGPTTDADIVPQDYWERMRAWQDFTVPTLFEAIKHGDEAHRQWLYDALDAYFAGKSVPRPSAPPVAQAEPVAWISGDALDALAMKNGTVAVVESKPDEYRCIPLYAAPPDPLTLEPLCARCGCLLPMPILRADSIAPVAVVKKITDRHYMGVFVDATRHLPVGTKLYDAPPEALEVAYSKGWLARADLERDPLTLIRATLMAAAKRVELLLVGDEYDEAVLTCRNVVLATDQAEILAAAKPGSGE